MPPLNPGPLDMHWQIAGFPVLPERLQVDLGDLGKRRHREVWVLIERTQDGFGDLAHHHPSRFLRSATSDAK